MEAAGLATGVISLAFDVFDNTIRSMWGVLARHGDADHVQSLNS